MPLWLVGPPCYNRTSRTLVSHQKSHYHEWPGCRWLWAQSCSVPCQECSLPTGFETRSRLVSTIQWVLEEAGQRIHCIVEYQNKSQANACMSVCVSLESHLLSCYGRRQPNQSQEGGRTIFLVAVKSDRAEPISYGTETRLLPTQLCRTGEGSLWFFLNCEESYQLSYILSVNIVLIKQTLQ